jgi:hypothetical protein
VPITKGENNKMKRLILVFALCVVACVLAPIGSSSAATLVGVCKFHGKATFEPHVGLLPNGTSGTTFTFESEAGSNHGLPPVGGKGAECREATAPTIVRVGSARVEGTGTLTCEAALDLGLVPGEVVGHGELVLGSEHFVFSEFRVVAAGGSVLFGVTSRPEAVAAAGLANFALSEDEAATACVGGAGSLEFEAVAAGAI